MIPSEINLIGSRVTLRSFSFTNDVTLLQGLLVNPRISSGGYRFNGIAIDPHNEALLQEEMLARWGDGSYEIMKVEVEGNFVGVTGVARQPTSTKPLTVLSGRTVLSPEVWGTSINAEVKLALYGALFEQGAERVEVIVALDNLRSLGSIVKFGFTPAEIVVRPMVNGGVNHFRRLKLECSDWARVREENLARILLKNALGS